MKKNSERRKIAVILANMNIEYAYETLRGIEEEAQEQQLDVYVFNANASVDEKLKHNVGEYNIYQLADYSAFDGIILFANLIQGYSVFHNIIDKIKKSGTPTISIDAELDGFYYLGVDNYTPMKHLVEHLVEKHNITKINYVSGMEFNSDSRERLQAYCDVLQEHNIPVEERRIFRGSFTNIHGRESAVKMLENPGDMPEAVVCATDSIALGVRSVLDNAGIKIPQQVILTGFDDSFEARNSLPTLTTVSRNQHQVGHEAVQRIVRKMRGEELLLKERFPAIPVFRESCGCHDGAEDDLISLRSKYVESARHYERHLFNCIMMAEDLSGSKSFSDFLKRMKTYVKNLESDAFYLCLDKELVEDLQYEDAEHSERIFHDNYLVEGFPEKMSVALAYEEGKFVKCEDMLSSQLLPNGAWDSVKGSNTYIFAPVHFRDYCMGYAIVKNSKFAMSSPLFSSWVIHLSNALESLRKQAHLKSMVEQLDKMYVVDSLTGLFNRFGFNRYAGESFSRCVSREKSFMILFADLDGLKQINDKFGHDNGDIAIAAVASALQGACEGDEICARIGGDEFVVYAEGYDAEEAEDYCLRLDKLLRETTEELDKGYRINVSYGYEVAFPDMGDTLERYVDMADNKMYLNKKKKKERL